MEDVVRRRLALVIGGTGGIGGAIAAALETCAWNVVAAGRNSPWPHRPALVVNAAGAGMRSTSRGTAAELMEPNVLVAERAGLLAVDAGCRLIQVGTPLSRTSLFDEGDPYVVTKSLASERLRQMPGLELIELRPHLVVGTTQCLVCRIARSLLEGRSFDLRTPQTERDLVHVSDVARAAVLAATVDVAPDEPIEIGSGDTIAMGQLVSLVGEIIGTDVTWTVDPDAPDSGRGLRLVAAPAPAREALGFVARCSIRQSVQCCINEVDRGVRP